MAPNLNKSEATLLENYRVALNNATEQPEIASEMAELGYDDEKIEEGKQLLNTTREVYTFNKKEDSETNDAHRSFRSLQSALSKTYMRHRKKAKVIFRSQPEVLKRLQIDGSVPDAYVKWMEMVKAFYAALAEDNSLVIQMQRLKIDDEQLVDAQSQITAVENARVVYVRERGESQDATQQKDQAFEAMDAWMSEFYAVARIALEDHPQLLEALVKVVR